MTPWLQLYGTAFLLAFGVAVALSLGCLLVAPRLGLVDRPGGHKFHRRATALGGGIAIYVASASVLLFEPMRHTSTWVLVAAGGVLTAVGLVDDFRSVPATLKFALLAVLTVVLWSFGIGAQTTRVPVLDLVITVLWVTAVSSAFNAIDNMDGLATGVTAIASAAFFVVALQTGQWMFGGLCVALAGASLGFLCLNFPPARLFMGDAGSFFLGFTLAGLGMLGEWNENEVIAAVIPVLVLGLPLFDLSFTVASRHLNGVTRTLVEALSHCGTDHVSHRLVRLGLDTRSAVVVLYLIAASFGVSAVSLQNAFSWVGLLHLLQALIVAAALTFVLRATPDLTPQRRQSAPALPALVGSSRWLWLLVAALAALLVMRLAP